MQGLKLNHVSKSSHRAPVGFLDMLDVGYAWINSKMWFALTKHLFSRDVTLNALSIDALPWRHNERDGVSNHQPRDCLLNRLFRRRSKKTSKLRVTGLCGGNSSPHKGPVTRKMSPFDGIIITGDPLHSRAACTQPCNVNTHSRAHCSPGARLCEQWEHGCVNNGARLCASARLCRGSPVIMFNNCHGRRQPQGRAVVENSVSTHWDLNKMDALNAISW